MGNKFTSLSLGIVFSLSCLTGKAVAMEDRDDNMIVGGEVINEQNLGKLLICEHNDGTQLTRPGSGEKNFILKSIEHYNEKDAWDCLQKLFENKQSGDKETLYSKEKHTKDIGDFRLDQPAKITTENKSPINTKDKKIKTNKYKNKRNKNFNNFDDASIGSSSTSDNSSFDEIVSNEKGDVVVIINVQKKSDTYCEVVVRRNVLKYFGMLSNKPKDPDSVLREAVNRVMNDADTHLSELCSDGRPLSKKNLETWKKGVMDEGFDQLNKKLRNELDAKLSKSQDAKAAWNNFRDESNKEKIRPTWNNLKTKLSNLLNNVEDNKNEDDIDDEKLAELTEKIKEMLKESLDKKKVYAIYCD